MKRSCSACGQGGASLVRRVMYVHSGEARYLDAALAALPESVKRWRASERAKRLPAGNLSAVAGVEKR